MDTSGRHKQEESLFEEMLQVSNAVVSVSHTLSRICHKCHFGTTAVYGVFVKMSKTGLKYNTTQ